VNYQSYIFLKVNQIIIECIPRSLYSIVINFNVTQKGFVLRVPGNLHNLGRRHSRAQKASDSCPAQIVKPEIGNAGGGERSVERFLRAGMDSEDQTAACFGRFLFQSLKFLDQTGRDRHDSRL